VAACCLLVLLLPALALSIRDGDDGSTTLPPTPTDHPSLTPTTMADLAEAESTW
jgi:hypothetical protein